MSLRASLLQAISYHGQQYFSHRYAVATSLGQLLVVAIPRVGLRFGMGPVPLEIKPADPRFRETSQWIEAEFSLEAAD